MLTKLRIRVWRSTVDGDSEEPEVYWLNCDEAIDVLDSILAMATPVTSNGVLQMIEIHTIEQLMLQLELDEVF